MALTSETLDLSSGTVDITIYATEFTVTESFDVESLGSISYTHDVPDNAEQDASQVRSILGTVELTCWDTMSGGSSLWSQLFKIADSAFVLWEYTDRDGNEKPFYFSLKKGDFSIDAQKKRTEVKFTSLPKNLFTATETYNTTEQTVTNRAISGGSPGTVNGAGQTGTTINTSTLSTIPSDGDIVYFGNVNTQAYIVDSATSTSITFKYSVDTAPADGASILTRDVTGDVNFSDFLINGTSDSCTSAWLFVKAVLEDLPNEIPNALDITYQNEIVIESYPRRFESRDILEEDTSADIGNFGIFVRSKDVNTEIKNNSYELLSRMAAIMGCLFGFGFGKTWFTPRLNASNSVTLSLDDMVDLQFKVPDQNFATISMLTLQTVYTGTIVNYAPYDNNVSTNIPDADTVFKYTGDARNALIGEIISGVGAEVDTDTGTAGTFQLSQNWAELGLAGYVAAKGHRLNSAILGLVNDPFVVPLQIEFEIYDVNKVLPYQTIEFDTTVDSQFQGNTYRPFEIDYDFERNVITGTAYKIA